MPDLARFDALGAHGERRSFVFQGLVQVVEAQALSEVLPAFRVIEEAVAAGLHAAGFVAYEAAPAFEPALAVRPPEGSLPLLRFGLFRERAEGRPPALGEPGGAFSLGEWVPSISEERYASAVERIRERIAA